jgi:cell division protein FtsB
VKWFAVALGAALLLLQYRIWLSTDGVSEVVRLRRAVAAQQNDNERLSARNRQLAAEVRDLKQGYSALEERARSDLGMVASNETFFQVGPVEAPVSAPTPHDSSTVPQAPRPLRPAATGNPPPARTAALR